MSRFKYVGEVEAIHGQYFDIPDEIQAPQARRYIEELHEAEKQAALEQQELELAARQDEAGAAAPDSGELAQLREELEGLHQRLDEPDSRKYESAISRNASAMETTWALSQKLESLQKRAREAVEADEHALDSAETFYREAQQQQERTMKLLRSNQKIVNGSISSTSKGLADLRQQLADAHKEVGELKAAASANRALIAKAGKIVKAWEQSSAASQLPPANSTEGRVSK